MIGDAEEKLPPGDPQVSQSRLQLIWDVVVFQFKLAADGLRDLVLVPVSIVAAIVGLLIGGDRPGGYFQRVLKFGRRTEYWINLFGHRHHAGTSDEIIKPLQDRVFAEAGNNQWLQKAGSRLNRSLDTVGKAIHHSPSGDSEKNSGQNSGENSGENSGKN